MMPKNNADIKRMRRSFAGFYTASVVLLLLVAFAFASTRKKETTDDKTVGVQTTASGDRELLEYDAVLHQRVGRLQQLDEEYALLLTDAMPGTVMDNTIKQMVEAESALGVTIDSIEAKRDSYSDDDNSVKRFDSLTAAFRSLLRNRRAMAGVRTALLESSNSFSADEKAVLKMETDLKKKDDRIAELEKLLKNAQSSMTAYQPQKDPFIETADKDKDKNMEEIRNTISQQEKRMSIMAANNNSLKQDNDNLKIQLEELRSNDNNNRGNSAAMQRKLDDMNAALLLAQVDCNLNRADASKLISNSRQRKELLTEALNTLKSLSGSGNSVVQQKVKDKTDQLNRIASTVRD